MFYKALKWLFVGKPLEGSPNARIENEDYNTRLTLRETTRKDTGKYLLVAENESGKDECEVEVNILDKPGKPKGPLNVTDVHKEGCKLKWQKPEGWE